nr:HAMP domain-containing sensor histidine kinase [Nocardioides flavescens]
MRGRIVSLAVGATVAVLVLFAVPVWLLEARTASSDVEQQAVQTARSVADYVSAGAGSDDLEAYVDRVNDRDDATPVAVLAPDGTTYGPDLPGASEQRGSGPGDGDGDRDGPFLTQSGVDVDDVDGGRLVHLVVGTQGGPTSVVAFASEARVRSTLAERLFPLGAAAALLLVLVAVAAELVSRRLVRDLDRTAELADAIAVGAPAGRVPESGPPEVRRVAHALNGLSERIEELLAAERETAADLSHRLRTPLMALRLDVDALEQGRARTELEQHVTSLERTLTAVIHEARRTQREGVVARCDPGPVAAACAAYWQPLIEDQGRDLAVDVADGLPAVRCSEQDLRDALDALVENAVAHTPDLTPLAVRAVADPSGGVTVEVRDQGAGFDPDAVRRGRSDRGSTGLGLDIARRCAAASGGRLVVDRDGPWSVVRLELGAAHSAI